MPKATVQAALAGLPYDAAVASFGPDSREAKHAEVILALGVLAIAVTAPLGAVVVAVSGERLLNQTKTEDLYDTSRMGAKEKDILRDAAVMNAGEIMVAGEPNGDDAIERV
jgi:hypothetical protein